MNDHETPRRRYRWLLLGMLILLGICMLGVGAHQHETAVVNGVSKLRPGMSDAEVQAILKPLSNGFVFMIKRQDKAGGEYWVRATDEEVVVVMEEKDGALHLAQVRRVPDQGPFLDRTRRNWEERRRYWEARFR